MLHQDPCNTRVECNTIRYTRVGGWKIVLVKLSIQDVLNSYSLGNNKCNFATPTQDSQEIPFDYRGSKECSQYNFIANQE